jgi:hypothetical protein
LNHRKFLLQSGEHKITSQFKFTCKRDTDPIVNAVYSKEDSSLLIDIVGEDGCLVELSMLQFMSILPILTALFFALFGIAYLYTGFLFKIHAKAVFIIFSELFLFFSLYFMFVESLPTVSNKIVGASIFLVIIIIVCVLSFLFTPVFISTLAFLAAIHLGCILKLFLQDYSSFFFSPYTEWWLIMLFTIIFVLISMLSTEGFLIATTSTFGSSLTLISLKYFNCTDYDFLYNIQLEKFSRLNEIDPENAKFSGIFLISMTTGVIIQYFILRKYIGSKDEIDILNQSGRKVQVNIDNI